MKKIALIFLAHFITQQSFSAEISLEQYLEKVRVSNIDIKLEDEKLKASESRAVGIRLPSPMASLIQMKEESGGSPNGFEINQQLPFPTKITSEHKIRKLEANAQNKMLIVGINQAVAKAKMAFIELWVAQENISVINQQKNILINHIKLSRSAARSDSFLKLHLLRAQSDLDLLENEIETAKQKLKVKQLALAEIINEDPDTFLPIAIEPPISAIPNAAQENIPQLELMKLTLESFKERESLAKASWLPDFNFTYKKMGSSSMSESYSEIMVGITLPFIYPWQPKAEAQSAGVEKYQAELNYSREKRSIEIKTVALRSLANSLQVQLLNLKNKLIPRAHQRMKIVLNLAPRDMETIQDHRETMEALPELKMKEIDLQMQYEESIIELEKYEDNSGLSK